MYTAIIRFLERHLSMNKSSDRKPNQPMDAREAITLTLYSFGGVVLIVAAIYFMTL